MPQGTKKSFGINRVIWYRRTSLIKDVKVTFFGDRVLDFLKVCRSVYREEVIVLETCSGVLTQSLCIFSLFF